MPKYFIIIVSAILIFPTAEAQVNPSVKSPLTSSSDNSFIQQLSLTDFNGKIFEKYSPDIQGTPFFTEGFASSILVLHNNKKIDSVKSRIDFYNQEIDLVLANNIKTIAGPGMIKEILLIDSLQPSKILYRFACGFPVIDNQNQNNYYEILSEGKISFLKSVRKKIAERKDEISGEITKEFETFEDYYIFSDNKMLKIKRTNQFYIEICADKKQEVETYIKEKKINSKSIGSIKQLIDYYNSLW